MLSVRFSETSQNSELTTKTDKVRLLYDRTQPTARLIVKNKEDLCTPLVRLLQLHANTDLNTRRI